MNPKKVLNKFGLKKKQFGGKNDRDYDGVPNKKDCDPNSMMRTRGGYGGGVFFAGKQAARFSRFPRLSLRGTFWTREELGEIATEKGERYGGKDPKGKG
jgi:hypothetical protein